MVKSCKRSSSCYDSCSDDSDYDLDDIKCYNENPFLTGKIDFKSKKKMAKRRRSSSRRKRRSGGRSQYQQFVGAYIRKNHRSGSKVTTTMRRAAAEWRKRGCKRSPGKYACKAASVRRRRRRRY